MNVNDCALRTAGRKANSGKGVNVSGASYGTRVPAARGSCAALMTGALAPIALAASAFAGVSPFAVAVEGFDPGVGGVPGFDSPQVVVGSPERFTGEGIFPSVVSPFSPPYLPEEVVSIGAGGWIVVRFDHPVQDDPRNPFGVDLLIFGNTGFIDELFPLGVVGTPFSDGGGVVEVSEDGERWVTVPNALADGLFPTLGWLDAGPYDTRPGAVPSDFTRPVDPALALEQLFGLDYLSLVELYNGAGGGAGIDLAGTGLASISYVRVSVPEGARQSVEIDALADVAPDAGRPAADLDGDGAVDGADLGLLLAAWGGDGPADLDGSGAVNGADLGALLAAWSEGSRP